MDFSLLYEKPIYFSPTLARKIGAAPAIFAQHLHNSISNPSIAFEKDGRNWVRKELDDLKTELFFTEEEIKSIIRRLKRRGVLLVDGDNYSIDHDVLDSLPEKRR